MDVKCLPPTLQYPQVASGLPSSSWTENCPTSRALVPVKGYSIHVYINASLLLVIGEMHVMIVIGSSYDMLVFQKIV